MCRLFILLLFVSCVSGYEASLISFLSTHVFGPLLGKFGPPQVQRAVNTYFKQDNSSSSSSISSSSSSEDIETLIHKGLQKSFRHGRRKNKELQAIDQRLPPDETFTDYSGESESEQAARLSTFDSTISFGSSLKQDGPSEIFVSESDLSFSTAAASVAKKEEFIDMVDSKHPSISEPSKQPAVESEVPAVIEFKTEKELALDIEAPSRVEIPKSDTIISNGTRKRFRAWWKAKRERQKALNSENK